jgi:hypothetical protein
MSKARLHWFWRGAIAVVTGTTLHFLLLELPNVLNRDVYAPIYGLVYRTGMSAAWIAATSYFIVLTLPSVVAAVVAYGILTRPFRHAPDGELHCRRCNHNLRGLSEPRCPECGEAI